MGGRSHRRAGDVSMDGWMNGWTEVMDGVINQLINRYEKYVSFIFDYNSPSLSLPSIPDFQALSINLHFFPRSQFQQFLRAFFTFCLFGFRPPSDISTASPSSRYNFFYLYHPSGYPFLSLTVTPASPFLLRSIPPCVPLSLTIPFISAAFLSSFSTCLHLLHPLHLLPIKLLFFLFQSFSSFYSSPILFFTL